MFATSSKEELIDSVLRLRRVLRVADDAVCQELEPVLERMEQLVGPTLNRSQTARLLGVSHTAIARWIKKGDIATVLTPRGREEVPAAEVLGLLERTRAEPGDKRGHAVARVMHGLRDDAAQLDLAALLPRRRSAAGDGGHERPALQSLMYHRLVATRLDDQLVSEARRRLRRWQRDEQIHPGWAQEWEQILAQPLEEIAKIIRTDDEHERSLRQSSPFAGALSEHERLKLLDAVAAHS